jgi:hypothetical protein
MVQRCIWGDHEYRYAGAAGHAYRVPAHTAFPGDRAKLRYRCLRQSAADRIPENLPVSSLTPRRRPPYRP